MRVIEHEEKFYEESLEGGELDLREKNSYVYIEAAFKKPMVVLGWGISGKKGMLHGTGTERRGVVTEYKMKFMTHTSDWVFINNSKTGNEVYTNIFDKYMLSLINFLSNRIHITSCGGLIMCAVLHGDIYNMDFSKERLEILYENEYLVFFTIVMSVLEKNSPRNSRFPVRLVFVINVSFFLLPSSATVKMDKGENMEMFVMQRTMTLLASLIK